MVELRSRIFPIAATIVLVGSSIGALGLTAAAAEESEDMSEAVASAWQPRIADESNDPVVAEAIAGL